ncbi:MAG TPA: glycerol-3-phosphate 1-O-acyltransferase PlsY [Candidatus Binatia bacterium]|nr:glycerol-3-phosphate 1-O-acyltransferase PlsY [Candidatus Binatia bacterium]
MAIPFHPIPVILGFLLGSIPSGLWIARVRGVDLRKVGSGNIGATNAIRGLGPRWGGLVFAIDTAKGAVAALLGQGHVPTALAAGAAAILGHVFSPWARFKGGRGVATSLGVFLAILPVPALLALAIWIVLFALSRRVSVGSLGAAIAYPLLVLWLAPHDEYRLARVVAGILVALLVVIRHIPNIRRLAAGNEAPSFGGKGAKP